jgi:hypothetical protein
VSTRSANGIVTIAASGQLIKASVDLTEHFADRARRPGRRPLQNPDHAGRHRPRGRFVRPDIATGLLHVNDAYGRMQTGSPASSYANVYYECTVAGTTHATTEPTYDPTIGNTVDGTATFIAATPGRAARPEKRPAR